MSISIVAAIASELQVWQRGDMSLVIAVRSANRHYRRMMTMSALTLVTIMSMTSSTSLQDEAQVSCVNLDACMAWFDGKVPASDDGRRDALCDIGQAVLPQFGDKAKYRLLELLDGSHLGWRNLSSCVIQKFPGLNEADVFALAQSLRNSHGGWAANALGRIGSDDAIRALIEDLPHGSASQTGWALQKLGEPALPWLFDYLVAHGDGDAAAYGEAQNVIQDMGATAAVIAPDWQRIATNTNEPIRRRIAALRGIEAMGVHAAVVGPAIATLLNEDNVAIREAAQNTLSKLRDISALEHLLAQCPPVEVELDSWADGSCLEEIAKFGPSAEPYGAKIVAHLKSRSANDQASAAVTLGMIGYQPAIANLTHALSSDDWRLVMASARSLGWMKAKTARHALETIASTHWLNVVRKTAAEALNALDSDQRPTGPVYDWKPLFDTNDPFNFDTAPFHGTSASCYGGLWHWGNGEIADASIDSENREDKSELLAAVSGIKSLSEVHIVEGGRLLGTNRGEWGGELYFQGANQSPRKLYEGNISGIEDGPDGIVAVTGIAHMIMIFGYVLSVIPAASHGYVVRRKFPLPGAPWRLSRVGINDLLINTTTGAYVLHSGWHMEQASCAVADGTKNLHSE